MATEPESVGKRRMNPDRELCLEILTRLREAQVDARSAPEGSYRQISAVARWRAFDECYTELKGQGYAAK